MNRESHPVLENVASKKASMVPDNAPGTSLNEGPDTGSKADNTRLPAPLRRTMAAQGFASTNPWDAATDDDGSEDSDEASPPSRKQQRSQEGHHRTAALRRQALRRK